MAALTDTLRRSISLTASAKALIDEVADLYDNDDWNARRVATAALEAERPAYWTRFGYSAQRACLLQLAANGMSLTDALKGTYHYADRVAGLDSLVPLNDQAAIALAAQYSEYGVWRDVDELMARRERRAA